MPMTPQLFSIDHAPLHMPIWHQMMEDLCHPPPERVARVLGISVRTVQRYNRAGFAPRSVCLSIFWLTSWGRSAVHAQATNDARLMASYVDVLTRHAEALASQVEHLLSIGSFGSANDPTAHQPTVNRRHAHAVDQDPAANDPRPSEALPAILAHLSRINHARTGPASGAPEERP